MPVPLFGTSWNRQEYVFAVFLVILGPAMMAVANYVPVGMPQNILPIYPVLIVAAVGLVALETCHRPKKRRRHASANSNGAEAWHPVWAKAWHPVWAACVVVGVELAVLWVWPARDDSMPKMMAMWDDVLRVSDPNQNVADLKGELVFRPRGSYYVFEALTSEHFIRGYWVDDVPMRLINSRTRVAGGRVRRMPAPAAQFVADNYISVGRISVAGKLLAAQGMPRIPFDVQIPGQYCLVTPHGLAQGLVDGKAIGRGRWLERGPHEYKRAKGETTLALIWAQAVERGFSPAWPDAAGQGEVSPIAQP